MIAKTDLPAGLRLDTLAVREGLPPSQWGENSEALFLTSSFVHPDAATAAARFANEEEAFVYSRFSNPTVTMMERRMRRWKAPAAASRRRSGMSAILIIIMSLLKAATTWCARRVSSAARSAVPGLCQVRRSRPALSADRDHGLA